jgi:hypothetical protein
MKNTKNSVIGLSLVTALLLGTSAYAGLIKTTADLNNIVVTPNTQFGFGGWNLDNVNVKIVDISDYSSPVPGSVFSEIDGSYGPTMTNGMSFESEITTGSAVRAKLHGKDWPIGEPSGIKIINNDTKVKHGKPLNCIMTTSYLSEFSTDNGVNGYLDAFAQGNTPQPVICSSPFQTHKRFKLNLLPTIVAGKADGEYGESVEISFNLVAGDTSVQRYQILQKINNYTNKRLDGYKIEVLDKDGNPNTALTLSLGQGENAGEDIWDTSELANFSHGLWGAADGDHFLLDGFFDNIRAYYPATLANNTISYIGDMKGGNYQSLFGNWIPSIWQPPGIFFDGDNNPDTDADLVAYYGDPEHPFDGTNNAWHKGKIDNWATPTAEELLAWEVDERYEKDYVEDTLNLGLNYIVNVGAITEKFTIRITPHIASEQRAPGYVGGNIPDDGNTTNPPPVEELPIDTIPNGTVSISPLEFFIIGEHLIIGLKEVNGLDPTKVDTRQVAVTTDTGDKETVTVTETTITSGIFSGEIDTALTASSPVTGNNVIDVINDAEVTATYGSSTSTTIAKILTDDPDEALDSSGDTASSGGGGGCTSNPNAKSFDMMFLLLAALGALYPFRRKLFAKQA